MRSAAWQGVARFEGHLTVLLSARALHGRCAPVQRRRLPWRASQAAVDALPSDAQRATRLDERRQHAARLEIGLDIAPQEWRQYPWSRRLAPRNGHDGRVGDGGKDGWPIGGGDVTVGMPVSMYGPKLPPSIGYTSGNHCNPRRASNPGETSSPKLGGWVVKHAGS